MDTSTETVYKYYCEGYSITFTECDETNSCQCHDCVQFGFIKHPENT